MSDPFAASAAASAAERDVLGSPREVQLQDRDVLDDYALRHARLRGTLTSGQDWRRRGSRSLTRRLLGGALLGALLVGGVAAVTFVQTQLAGQQAGRDARPSPTAVVAGTPSRAPAPAATPFPAASPASPPTPAAAAT